MRVSKILVDQVGLGNSGCVARIRASQRGRVDFVIATERRIDRIELVESEWIWVQGDQFAAAWILRIEDLDTLGGKFNRNCRFISSPFPVGQAPSRGCVLETLFNWAAVLGKDFVKLLDNRLFIKCNVRAVPGRESRDFYQ